jgi:hypothetical protein
LKQLSISGGNWYAKVYRCNYISLMKKSNTFTFLSI